MPSSHSVADFLNASGVMLDVRSPAEYAQGHLPGAISFPLFTDEERARVGICYKQHGRNQAVELGFAIAGPKFAGFIAHAQTLAPNRQARLYCWRGGMRSGAVAWVLELAGFGVSVLTGGYQAFRRWALAMVTEPRSIVILGGMTGTGKTAILAELARQGEQVLDLEWLASHRGSSFGGLGLPPQPTNEQFENAVALQWAMFDAHHPLWLEAESKRIGLCRIPIALFQQMEQAPVIEIIRSRKERLALLVQIYGCANVDTLVEATERIRKRLGGLRTQQAIALLHEGKMAAAFDLILDYYDKTYRYDLERRSVLTCSVEVTGLSNSEIAMQLIQQRQQLAVSVPQLSNVAPL